MEQRFKLRRVNEITGTFVLLILGGLVAVVLWMGHSQRWFRSNVTLHITFPESGAGGIRPGAEVHLLGTRVGAVSDVFLHPSGRMEARVNIRRDFFRFVREDSSAQVKRKFGLAGDSFFEITRGTGQALPESGATIACEEQPYKEWEATLEELRGEAISALKEAREGLELWKELSRDLRESREHIDQLVVRLDQLAAKVEAGEGTAGKLVTDPALADAAAALLASGHDTVSELRAVVTNLNAASVNVRAGTAQLPEITGKLAREAQDLPGLVQQTRSSIHEIDLVIQAMQRHWLLRRYVNRSNPPPSKAEQGAPRSSSRPPFRPPKGSGFK